MDAFRKSVTALVALGIIGACGASASAGEARSLVDRAPAGLGDATKAANSVNQLGFDLLRPHIGTSKGNVAISPWSIATALAMARAGAGGATATEMDTVLHLAEPTLLRQTMNGLDQELRSRNGTFNVADKRLSVELSPANRAFVQKDTKFEQTFLDELALSYGAGIGLVDYKAATEAARRAINEWDSAQTKKRIPELIAAGALDDLTRLVLVNALYLKADWETPFQPNQGRHVPRPGRRRHGAVHAREPAASLRERRRLEGCRTHVRGRTAGDDRARARRRPLR